MDKPKNGKIPKNIDSADFKRLQNCAHANAPFHDEMTRREFVVTTGVVGGGIALGLPSLAAAEQGGASHQLDVQLKINGQAHSLSLDTRVTLLDALRENLGLPDRRKGAITGNAAPAPYW
jgi:hypothetical protein